MSEVPPQHLEAPPAATRAAMGGCLTCGAIIAGIFVLLAVTVIRSDRVVLQDPQAVEANLQAIAPCAIPSGYRALRGADDGAGRRIAVLAPASFAGNSLDVDLPLLISAWGFPARVSLEKRKSEVRSFWTGKITDVLGDGTTTESSEQVVVRGSTLDAEVAKVVCKETTVRLVVLVVPQGEGSVLFAFVGDDERFDAVAMKAFLASVE